MTPSRGEMRAFVIGVLFALSVSLAAVYWHDAGLHDDQEPDRRRAATTRALAHRHAAVETLTVYVPVVQQARAESDRLSALVRTVGETTLEVRVTTSAPPQLVTVPAVVVEKMRADSVTIATQAELNRRQALVIAADSVAIDTLKAERDYWIDKKTPFCGRKCGVAIGVVATVGSIVLLEKARTLIEPRNRSGLHVAARFTLP